MIRLRFVRTLAIAATLLGAGEALAQGKGGKEGAKHAADAAPQASAPGQKKIPPGQAKKVTTDQAIVVARDVLQNNGYRVVRVERVGTSQVIWYRRGNMGNGKGQGPLQRMVVRPSASVVVFESAPRTLVDLIKQRLGL